MPTATTADEHCTLQTLQVFEPMHNIYLTYVFSACAILSRVAFACTVNTSCIYSILVEQKDALQAEIVDELARGLPAKGSVSGLLVSLINSVSRSSRRQW